MPGTLSSTNPYQQRRIALEKCLNLRDMGGYATATGQTTRWGLLYRSDELHQLTARDLRRIANLKLNLVCDLRSPSECQYRPSRIPSDDVAPRVVQLPVDAIGLDPHTIQQVLLSGQARGMDYETTMKAFYKSMVTQSRPAYAEMFRLLADPANIPALVHCTGGKDRTGMAMVLILLALDVPMETALEDYLLTNSYTAPRINQGLVMIWLMSRLRSSPRQVRPLLEARRVYVQAAVDAMVELSGSIPTFLRNGLGVSEEMLACLREALLE